MKEKMKQALRHVRENAPLVQCITNFVTVNDCANIILAAGGSPTMAMDAREVEEAVRDVSALVCNMGAIESVEAMCLAGREANKLHIPVILDPVAAVWIGEVIGTGVIGAMASYPFFKMFYGLDAQSPFYFIPFYTPSAMMGASMGVMAIVILQKNGMLARMQQALQ